MRDTIILFVAAILVAIGIVSMLLIGTSPDNAGPADDGNDTDWIQHVTDQTCDAREPCPEGYTCVAFDEFDEPRCAAEDPCSYYACPAGQQCVVMESYPLQIACQ